MHGDDDGDDEFSERRMSAKLLERRLHDLDTRVTTIERGVEQFPAIVEKKLKERATEERTSRAAMWGRVRAVVTTFAAIIGALAGCVAAYAAVTHGAH